PAQRGRRDPAVAPDPRYDQGQPVLGLRLQHRGVPAGGAGPAEPDAGRGGHGLLERVRGRQQPPPALVPQPRPRRPEARRALTAPRPHPPSHLPRGEPLPPQMPHPPTAPRPPGTSPRSTTTATSPTRPATSHGSSGSRARRAGCTGWWTRRSTASTSSPRSAP